MIGIISYAGYLPRYRLNRMNIFSAVGWLNQGLIMNAAGEKTVANFDEDAVSMATAAGRRCLQGYNPGELGALYLPLLRRLIKSGSVPISSPGHSAPLKRSAAPILEER